MALGLRYGSVMEWHILKGLPDEWVREVLSSSRRRRFAKREVLFHEGDPAASVHLIARGRVAVRVTTPLGAVATLDLLPPGSTVGEMALLQPDGLRSATAVALEPSETLVLDAARFAQLRRERPSVTEVLVEMLTARVRQLNERLLEALYVPADARLLRRLLELTDGEGTVAALTQEDLAGLAGTTRATVNRVLRREEKAGALALGRGRITVLDPDGLRRRAH